MNEKRPKEMKIFNVHLKKELFIQGFNLHVAFG